MMLPPAIEVRPFVASGVDRHAPGRSISPLMAPPPAPAVRATHLVDDLRSLSVLGPVAEARVRAQLSPASVKTFEAASRTAHLPLAFNIEMAEAVYRVAGEAGSRRWGTASFVASLDGFFKPLLVGLTRLVAPSPTLMFKTFPQGWATTYRGCGEFLVSQPAPGQTRLVGRGLAPAMLCPAYLAAVCGTLAGAFEVSSYTGTVTLEQRDPSSPDASWLVEWRRAEKG